MSNQIALMIATYTWLMFASLTLPIAFIKWVGRLLFGK